MFIKVFVTAAAFGLISSGACFAQAIYEKPLQPYAQPKPEASKPTAEEAKYLEAQNAEARPAGAVVVDGELRVPVNADVAAKIGIPVEVIASAPVPDTPANRARYGGPMSNGGQRTAAVGN
jgi:hypothetical protein